MTFLSKSSFLLRELFLFKDSELKNFTKKILSKFISILIIKFSILESISKTSSILL